MVKTVYQSKGTSGAYAPYIYAQCVPPIVNKTVYVELTFKDIGYGKITIDYNSATSDYQTVEGKNTFLLDHGGNIQISGSNISTPAIRKSNDQLITSATKSFFDLRVLGNPTENHFGLQPISSDKLGRMVIRITDANGRVIEQFDQLKDGQTLLIGDAYRQGIYFAELLQGNQRKVVRLMKLK
jgi:hypothetical protein